MADTLYVASAPAPHVVYMDACEHISIVRGVITVCISTHIAVPDTRKRGFSGALATTAFVKMSIAAARDLHNRLGAAIAATERPDGPLS